MAIKSTHFIVLANKGRGFRVIPAGNTLESVTDVLEARVVCAQPRTMHLYKEIPFVLSQTTTVTLGKKRGRKPGRPAKVAKRGQPPKKTAVKKTAVKKTARVVPASQVPVVKPVENG